MTEEELERVLRSFKGKTIMEAKVLTEPDAGFDDVLTLRFSDMTKVSFTLSGSLEAGPE